MSSPEFDAQSIRVWIAAYTYLLGQSIGMKQPYIRHDFLQDMIFEMQRQIDAHESN